MRASLPTGNLCILDPLDSDGGRQCILLTTPLGHVAGDRHLILGYSRTRSSRHGAPALRIALVLVQVALAVRLPTRLLLCVLARLLRHRRLDATTRAEELRDGCATARDLACARALALARAVALALVVALARGLALAPATTCMRASRATGGPPRAPPSQCRADPAWDTVQTPRRAG